MPWKDIAGAIGLGDGGAVRSALDQVWTALGLDRLTERTPVRQRVAFTIAFVALAAKLSKADGVSVAIESEAFERMYDVADDQRANARYLFDMAKQDIAGFETYARTIAGYFDEDPELLGDVFACLFHVASADGILHRGEEAFLRTVAREFGLTDRQFAAIRAQYVRDPESPYVVLGIEPTATDAEVKARHRALVLETHPDRLAAHGVPAELLRVADRRLAAINAAHEAILKERGLKERAT